MTDKLISLVGSSGVGKSTFARWFIKQYPFYTWIDIARVRSLLKDEDDVWDITQELVSSNKLVLLESTGLSSRLQPIYNSSAKTCIVLLSDSGDVLIERLSRRPNSELELYVMEKDLEDISKLPVDIVCDKLSTDQYSNLASIIFNKLL